MSIDKLKTVYSAGAFINNVKVFFKKINEIIDYLNDNSSSLGYTEKIVDISSVQILTLGSVPVELLPAPGENKYYNIDKIVLEFTYGTVPYSDPDNPLRIAGNGLDVYVDKEVILAEQNVVSVSKDVLLKLQSGVDGYVYRKVIKTNESISIFINGGVDVADGDGTLRVKIYYKVLTFGE